MTERRLYLDAGIVETRGVVAQDGRPERLLIDRDGDPAAQKLGARVVGRVRRVERAAALAFVDLGEGPDAVINLTAESGRLVEGEALEVEVRAEARSGKGASVRVIGPGAGAPRLLEPAPAMEARLAAFARGAEIVRGSIARTMADGAQDEALQTIFPLPGGGSLAVETTRALIAVDVDLGGRPGGEAKRAAKSANLAAIGAAARVLRLKGLGGLVVIDFIGRGHDGPALISAARGAFAPDNPGVALGPVSRFGTLELTIPRRSRGVLDVLVDETGELSMLSQALVVIRALEREAASDGGGRFEAIAAPDVAEAAGPALKVLKARVGVRVAIRAEPGRAREDFEVVRR
ncbi:MAG TPA: ribonuclease E/G [Caulobacteraceae bacterium]|nr:ribonuclease E/G [Caulobacteraceae bacterium]